MKRNQNKAWYDYCVKLIEKGIPPDLAIAKVRYLKHYERYLVMQEKYLELIKG